MKLICMPQSESPSWSWPRSAEGQGHSGCSRPAGLWLVPSTPPASRKQGGFRCMSSVISVSTRRLPRLEFFIVLLSSQSTVQTVSAPCRRQAQHGWTAVFEHPWREALPGLLGNQQVSNVMVKPSLILWSDINVSSLQDRKCKARLNEQS